MQLTHNATRPYAIDSQYYATPELLHAQSYVSLAHVAKKPSLFVDLPTKGLNRKRDILQTQVFFLPQKEINLCSRRTNARPDILMQRFLLNESFF